MDHTKSGNNLFIDKQPQSNFSIHNIIRAVRKLGPCCLFVVFDYKSAYKNINTAISDWHLSLERDPTTNHILLENRLQWGSSPVGVKWEDIVRLARLLMIYYLHLLIIHYVDDVTDIIPPDSKGNYDHSAIYDHIVAIQIIHNALGIEIGKWQYGSLIDVLGFTLNTTLNHTSIQEKRINKFILTSNNIISSNSVKVRAFASITGQLSSFSFILPFIKAYLSKLFNTISNRSQHGWDSFVRVSNELKELLLTINDHITRSPGGPKLKLIIQPRYNESFLTYTDASKKFIGWAYPSNREMLTIPISTENQVAYTVQDEISMPSLEGAAVTAAAADFIFNFRCFTNNLIIYTDSYPFIQAFEKGWSHSSVLNKIIANLQLLITEHDISFTLEWVETDRNLADYPSRHYPVFSNQLCERKGHAQEYLIRLFGDPCAWKHRSHNWTTLEANWWVSSFLSDQPGLIITPPSYQNMI